MASDLRDMVLSDLRLHPRVAYQGLFATEEDRARVLAALPRLSPFRKEYKGAVSVIDWDHRLPSAMLVLRIFAFYSDKSLAAGQEAFDDRLETIGVEDKYPEFDVPDFDNIAADEAYEVELGIDGAVGRCRLTSAWRREVARRDAKQAVEITRKSQDFADLVEQYDERPDFLGDLEAVSWTPPCESQHDAWTVDVWYLLEFDGRVGSGRSFLVDFDKKHVVAVRDFSVRTG